MILGSIFDFISYFESSSGTFEDRTLLLHCDPGLNIWLYAQILLFQLWFKLCIINLKWLASFVLITPSNVLTFHKWNPLKLEPRERCTNATLRFSQRLSDRVTETGFAKSSNQTAPSHCTLESISTEKGWKSTLLLALKSESKVYNCRLILGVCYLTNTKIIEVNTANVI